MSTRVQLIGDNSVDSGSIVNATIKTEDILDGAVTESKIGTGAVTNTKLAAASVTADKLASGVAIPSGVIVMWSGTATPYNATTNPRGIPTGWALCNGENGTPDLRERFIVGAGGNNTTQGQEVAGTNGYNVGDFGGANSVTLDKTQMPYHNHTASSSATVDRDYTYSPRSAGAQSGGSNKVEGLNNQLPTVTVTTTIGYTGGDSNGVTQAHENRPPYYALAYIMKS